MSGLAHIRAPGGRYLVTHVRESPGDTLVLETPRDAGGWWLPVAGTPVEVGTFHDGAIAWAGAVVTGAGAKDGSLVALRLLGSPVLVEQRRYPRVPLELEIEIRRGPAAGPVFGLCTDIGGGGLRVSVPLELDVGDLVRVALRPAGAAPVEATARVVRRIEPSSFGLAFELFVVGGRERVERLAFEHAATLR